MTRSQLDALVALNDLGAISEDTAVSTRDVEDKLRISHSAAWRRLNRLALQGLVVKQDGYFPQTSVRSTSWSLSFEGIAAIEDNQ